MKAALLLLPTLLSLLLTGPARSPLPRRPNLRGGLRGVVGHFLIAVARGPFEKGDGGDGRRADCAQSLRRVNVCRRVAQGFYQLRDCRGCFGPIIRYRDGR